MSKDYYTIEFRSTSARGAMLSVIVQHSAPDKIKVLDRIHKATHLSMTSNERRFGNREIVKVEFRLDWVTETLLKILPEKLAVRFLSEIIDSEIYKQLIA